MAVDEKQVALAVMFALVVTGGLLAGCMDEKFLGLQGSGCQATSRGNESLSICSSGCTSENGVACSGTCTAEWKVNGTAIFHQPTPCSESDYSQVLPLRDGSSVTWALEHNDDGLRCRLTIKEVGEPAWQLSTHCLEYQWGP